MEVNLDNGKMGGALPQTALPEHPRGSLLLIWSFLPSPQRLRQGLDSRRLSEENFTNHIITYSGAAGG